ncbi:MAG: hypothetical protein M1321_01865 [Candidatus Marsarchaeota archaeon]|nr:hypothetical protein [Candidatus Marsarchaeota archaeon]
MMYKILVASPEFFDDEAIAVLRKAGNVVSRKLTRAELLGEISDTDILLIRVDVKVDRELLEHAKKLKLIASATTGLDHIEVDYARKKSVKVINLGDAHTVSTAEYAFGLILGLCRKVPWAHESMIEGNEKRHLFAGRELSGLTLGLVGLGRIGSRVAGYGKAFGMKVIAFDPFVSSREFRMVTLEELLRESDVISLHSLLSKDTRGMISSGQFALMKRGAFLVNAARAELVDTAALISALESGAIAGAAVDVFNKRDMEDGAVARLARKGALLITPHIGALTQEAMHAAGMEIVRKVADAVSNGDI